jgi:VWFA-related protein
MQAGWRFLSRLTWAWLAAAMLVGLLASSALPAQEGVAGMPPVMSKPQNPPAPPATKSASIRVQSALVTTPVTVIDSRGEFVFGLTRKDFQIFDNGVPQRIERFDTTIRPLAAVIVVQTNQNVAPLLGQVRPLGPVFSSLMLGPQGQAAVISYDDRIRVLQDFSTDSDRLETTLRALKPQGEKARLNDALARALALLEKRPKSERGVIVAISDGSDQGSETGKEEIVRRATNAEITIYGLGFSRAHELLSKKPEAPAPNPLDTNVTRPLPPGGAPTPTASENVYMTPIPIVDILVATGQIIHSAVASSLLEYYAGYTGGVFYSHWSKAALQDQLSRVASEIQSQYDLAYVPDTLDQTGFHRIEIRVQQPGVKVRTRAGYFYQPTSP